MMPRSIAPCALIYAKKNAKYLSYVGILTRTHREKQQKRNGGVAQECVGQYLAMFFHNQMIYNGIG
jgi:hypothetical protein